jgi:hypothetical protein
VPENTIRLPPDGTGKYVRTRSRTISSNTVHEQYFIPAQERVVSAHVTINSFRTLGNAATAQTLLTLENQSGSSVLLGVRRLIVQMDSTAALTAVGVTFRASRVSGSAPTNGTTLSKQVFDTTESSASTTVARGATASDGGAATAITATAGTMIWQGQGQRLHTLAGIVLTDIVPVLPSLVESDPFVIRAGESIMVQVIAAAGTSNPTSNHYLLSCMLEEFTLP